MKVKLSPQHLRGTLPAMPSKSDAHRVLISAALSSAPTKIHLPMIAEDILATMRCLQALGAKIESTDGTYYTVSPIEPIRSAPVLDCGESGATLRFMLPVAAGLGAHAHFCGRGRLSVRPLKPLIDALSVHGVRFSSDRLPFFISGSLQAGDYALSEIPSSQFISGLLFALPLLERDSRITLTGAPPSGGYVEMTLRTLARFGISIHRDTNGFLIPGKQAYRSAGSVTIEGDWSNAAFFLSAAALGGDVSLTHLSSLSAQPDKRILALLQQFGATVDEIDNAFRVTHHSLHGITVDVDEIIDLVPILSVVACVAEGTTILKNATRLRFKESDRLIATSQALSALGADIRVEDDRLVIHGKPFLNGGTADSGGDHRIAMAIATASCVCRNPVIIENAQAVHKSYPQFFQDFNTLGGRAIVF